MRQKNIFLGGLHVKFADSLAHISLSDVFLTVRDD